MKEQDTIEINVIQLLKALWVKKLLILLVAIVTGVAAFAYSSFVVKPEYRSTTRIYVVNPTDVDIKSLVLRNFRRFNALG